jgi:hypothetical protein
MLSRRELIGKAAVGAGAAALTLGAARTAVAATGEVQGAPPVGPGIGMPSLPEKPAEREVAPPAEVAVLPPPWELVSPLAAGTAVAPGWRLAGLGPVQDGSCVVTLENARGRTRRIHLCRNDGSPQGLVYTRRVDFVVMNEGHGDLPTEEPLARAVVAVAHAVAANEGQAPDRLFSELLPHAERVQRFAAAAGAAADGKLR